MAAAAPKTAAGTTEEAAPRTQMRQGRARRQICRIGFETAATRSSKTPRQHRPPSAREPPTGPLRRVRSRRAWARVAHEPGNPDGAPTECEHATSTLHFWRPIHLGGHRLLGGVPHGTNPHVLADADAEVWLIIGRATDHSIIHPADPSHLGDGDAPTRQVEERPGAARTKTSHSPLSGCPAQGLGTTAPQPNCIRGGRPHATEEPKPRGGCRRAAVRPTPHARPAAGRLARRRCRHRLGSPTGGVSGGPAWPWPASAIALAPAPLCERGLDYRHGPWMAAPSSRSSQAR